MLIVENISFAYSSRPLFRGVNITVEPAKVTRIVGDNGCGKSTLLSVCAGLKNPNTGSLKWKEDGVVSGFSRDKFHYLPAEANGFFQKLTAFENLQFWLRLENPVISDIQIHEGLKKWGFQQELVRNFLKVAQFSTGMKRRLAFARLELSTTKCWILDEPLYGLDTKGVKSFVQLVKDHLGRNGSLLTVSHDLNGIAELPLNNIDFERWKNV